MPVAGWADHDGSVRMRVLVTGGRSLLARHVVQQLMDRGDDVVVLQRTSSGLACDEVLGDITDAGAVGQAVRGAEAIIHCAARVSVTGPWSEFERVNVVGTRVLLAAARASGVRRFIHISTPSVAHIGRSLVGAGAGPAEPDRARGHYARSKAMAELEVLAGDGPDLAVVALRPHLVWGPGDEQLIGRIVSRARQGRLVILGSGAALIDTIVVENAADAIIHALDRAEQPQVRGGVFVLSNGEPRPVAELLREIARACGAPAPQRHVPVRIAWLAGWIAERVWRGLGKSTDPPMTSFLAEQLSTAHWFDQRDVRRALEWTPRVSIDEGLRRLVAEDVPEA